MKEVQVDEIKKEDLSNVTVNLDDQGNVVEKKKKEEPKYVRLEDLEGVRKGIDNTREFTNRKITNLEAKIDQLLRGNQPVPVVSQQKEPTEWDTKLQKDWKGTVEELAEARIEAKLKQREETQRLEYERQQNINLLENNKRKVLDKHKDLMDETSPKAEVYRTVLQEHPEYLVNPFGPVLAMRDMEDKLKDSGYVDEPTKQIVQKEVIRQTRAGAGVVPNGASPNPSKRIVLTKEQKELCDQKGIKYENYAKFANQLKDKGGVEA